MPTREQQAFLRLLEYERSKPRRIFLGGGGLDVRIGLAAGQGNPVSAGPINFTVTFSAPAVGFTAGDVSFAGSTVGGTLVAVVTGSGPYNVAVTGMTGSGLVMISIPAGSATDATGKPFPGSLASAVSFVTGSNLLLEDNSFLLLESGDKLMLD
jgi:hypothetical protein